MTIEYDTLEKTIIFSDPNCTIGERQNMTCNYVAPSGLNNLQALNECNNLGFRSTGHQDPLKMAWLQINSLFDDPQKDDPVPTNYDLLANNALTKVDWSTLTNNSLIWIGTHIDRPNRSTGRAKHESTTSSSRTVTDGSAQGFYCQAWSTRRSEFQSVPCDTNLNVFCQSDLIVESPAPSKTSLKVMPGPTHITLDWQSPAEGWITNYKINFVPTKTSNKTKARSERADNLTTSHLYVNQNGSVDYEPKEIEFNKRGPPINITNLRPETGYKVLITTYLNPNTKTTLSLDEVITTANNSFGPEGIIGVRL